MYRMPVSFGPAPGPRNLPVDQRHRRYDKTVTALTLSARTDPGRLAKLLPEGFELDGDRIEIGLHWITNIGWLAGRGYNILLVRIPARWRGKEEAAGHFVPVVWESMADPILTGRDELGWCKIYADIAVPVIGNGGEWRAHASWEGYNFFELSADSFVESRAAMPPPQPMMFRKYIPGTGSQNADADYPTITGPDARPPDIVSAASGSGKFSFHRARWEDMPTQYPIVNVLADLPLDDFGPSFLVKSSGGGDASGQRRLA